MFRFRSNGMVIRYLLSWTFDRVGDLPDQGRPAAAQLSRLTEVGPRLIEVGPICSSVSLKLAHRLTAQGERPRLDSQSLRTRVGELAAG